MPTQPSDRPIMVNKVIKGDGTHVDIPLIGERFYHLDSFKGYATLKFHQMNGWKIIELLVPVILYFRPYCIVEIGAGASTLYFARLAEEAGVKLYSCDKSPRKNIVYFPGHKFHQVMSEEFMENFDDTPGIVLIDANHSYEMAKKEFDFFFEKLVPWGVIFLHDTLPAHEEYLEPTACHDCYRLRQELEQRTEEMDCFTWPFTAGYQGLTMVIKKDPERRYWEK
jgi:hypothetical protein